MSERVELNEAVSQSRPTTDDAEAWRAYWQSQDLPWRTEPEIAAERQGCLAERRTITPDYERGIFPFKDVEPKLTRADIEWLLATHESKGTVGPVQPDPEKDAAYATRRDGLDLSGANLERLDLHGLPLTRLWSGYSNPWGNRTPEQRQVAAINLRGANLRDAQLEGAMLCDAHLEGATLWNAHLEGADLTDAQLQGASLNWAQMKDAILLGAHLEGAHLRETQLMGADLFRAHLEGADLIGAWLKGVDLRGAFFDKSAQLNDAHLTQVSLDQTIFDNTNLSVVKWGEVPVLGDELRARATKDADGNTKGRRERSNDYQAAARAYRRLAVALQSNGMSEEASGYLYRAQIMQRRLQWHSRQPGAYLFSVLLAVLAGYGYRLKRIAITYMVVVALFAGAFLAQGIFAGGPLGVQQIFDAAQISLNAIHGRVFFAQFHLDTLQSWLATTESVFGIVIEGVFVAMLVQRFFGK